MRTASICFGLMFVVVCIGCSEAKTQAKKKKREPTNQMARWHASMRNSSRDFSSMKKVPGLLDQLKDHNPQTRIQACNGLAKIGADAKHAIKQLGNMNREDNSDEVRQAADNAIEQIINSMKKHPPDEAIEYARKQAEGL